MKRKQLTANDLLKRDLARKESAAELKQLKEHWPVLRRYVTAETLTVAWFLWGKGMFVAKRGL